MDSILLMIIPPLIKLTLFNLRFIMIINNLATSPMKYSSSEQDTFAPKYVQNYEKPWV